MAIALNREKSKHSWGVRLVVQQADTIFATSLEVDGRYKVRISSKRTIEWSRFAGLLKSNGLVMSGVHFSARRPERVPMEIWNSGWLRSGFQDLAIGKYSACIPK
jgi:hypothetical protein